VTIVIDNPDSNHLVSRLRFADKMLTVIYRAYACGEWPLAKNFMDLFRRHMPGVRARHVSGTEDNAIAHGSIREIASLHIHFEFTQSIENIDSVRNIVRALSYLQNDVSNVWEMTALAQQQKKYNVSACLTIFFSEKKMLSIVDKIFQLPQSSYPELGIELCYWGSTNNQTLFLPCKDISNSDFLTKQELNGQFRKIFGVLQTFASQKEKDIKASHRVEALVLALIFFALLVCAAKYLFWDKPEKSPRHLR
jgi:hypothetical protein